VDGGSVRFKDEVYGYIEKRYEDIEDFVIVRSMASPCMSFPTRWMISATGSRMSCGDRTALPIPLNRSLYIMPLAKQGPCLCPHVPYPGPIKRPKISKEGPGEIVAVHFYRDHGFIPWAFVNFLVLLGWSTPDQGQIFSRDELNRGLFP